MTTQKIVDSLTSYINEVTRQLGDLQYLEVLDEIENWCNSSFAAKREELERLGREE